MVFSDYNLSHVHPLQELSNHVGLNVAQATSESIGAREIEDLIEKDIPQVCVVSSHDSILNEKESVWGHWSDFLIMHANN